MTQHNTELTILSTTIRQDDQGRYCLNDCHKASGAAKKDGPSYWLATTDAQKLASRLDSETTGKSVVTNEGRNGGTYVAKELVYAYAMWINVDFHLTVIRFSSLRIWFTRRPERPSSFPSSVGVL